MLSLLILISILLGAFFEVVCVYSLVPFIDILANANNTEHEFIIKKIYSNLDNASIQEIILYSGISVVTLFILKNVYLLVINYVSHRFIYRNYANLSTRVFKHYLTMPYIMHLHRNSAELLRNVNQEAFWLFANILIPGIMVITEIMVVIALLIALLYLHVKATLVIIFVGGLIMFSLMKITKLKMSELGSKSQFYLGEMIKAVNQGLGGIKETIVSNNGRYFLDAYFYNVSRYAKNSSKLKNISQWPRYIIEILSVSSLVLVPIIMMQYVSNIAEILPAIGLFGAAAIRLMPSFNRIMSSYTHIRYYVPSLDVIYNELKIMDECQKDSKSIPHAEQIGIKKGSCELENELTIRDVHYKHPESDKSVINGVSFTIKKGEKIGIVGKSGAGKTTLVDLIIGVLKPEKGGIFIDGSDIHDNLTSWQSQIGYVPQNIYLLDDTILKNIAYGVEDDLIDTKKINDALEGAKLDHFVLNMQEGYDTLIGENGTRISGGQRQRIGIARALYKDTNVIIMDEGTSSLDNETQKSIRQSIDDLSRDKTVIIVAHRLDTVKHCDLIIVLGNGEIAESGTYDELSKKGGVFQDMLEA